MGRDDGAGASINSVVGERIYIYININLAWLGTFLGQPTLERGGRQKKLSDDLPVIPAKDLISKEGGKGSLILSGTYCILFPSTSN